MSDKPYFLAVRGLVYNDRNEILVMQRSSKSRHQPGFWEFPGGKVDPGENFADAIVREFKEETGLEVKIEKVLGSGEWEREDYRIAYLFLQVKQIGGVLQMSAEHDDLAWVSQNRLKDIQFSPQLHKFVRSLS
jgi:8-oxo-dGTP diphosphatase